jgi:lipopolysaccharide biosynthesis glycosyltransferase
MDIAFVTDNNYALPTRAAIRSVLANAGRADAPPAVRVVCDDSVSVKNLARFARLGGTVSVTRAANRHRQLHNTAHYSHAMYLKYDLPEIFPTLDKVLFLDSDVIVSGSLRELWATDLSDRWLAAVPENAPASAFAEYARARFNASGAYFNSGVLLLNLRQLRADGVPRQLAEFTAQRPWLSCPDQDAFNAVCGTRALPLPAQFNHMVMYRGAADGEAARVIHYASWHKPWRDLSVPLARNFTRHLRLTEKLALLPRWLAALWFYAKLPAGDGGVRRVFKFFGLPLYTKEKSPRGVTVSVLGLTVNKKIY